MQVPETGSLEERCSTPPRNLGSLLRLFKSDFFDSWIAISYLFRYRSPDDIEFYLAELCRLLVYIPFESRALERFIMDKCSQSVHIALQVFWLLSAEMECTESHSRRCEQLQHSCYKAVANIKQDFFAKSSSAEDLSSESESTLFHHRRSISMTNTMDTSLISSEGQKRVDYFNNIKEFVGALGEISEKLQSFPVQLRQSALEGELGSLDEDLSVGIYLPLWESSTTHFCICRLVPEEAKVLKSREKVPYIVTFECVEAIEPSCSNVIHLAAHNIADAVIKHASEQQRKKLEPPFDIYSRSPFGEPFEVKEKRVREHSPFGTLANWGLKSVIVKYGDDCRQEFLAMQLITQIKKIFDEVELPLYLRPYHILVNSIDSGLIEVVNDAVSIHQLKQYYKRDDDKANITLLEHFKRFYGDNTAHFQQSVKNFVESLAGYSLVSYLLQLKDRHNANIMICSSGHLVHIDFGFMLSLSPGGINAEKAPFKLTMDYLEVMGGMESSMYQYFKELLLKGYLELRKHHEKIILIVEMMSIGSRLPCYSGDSNSTITSLKERFNLSLTEKGVMEFIENLIQQSKDNWRTKGYDKFQYFTNKILY